MLSKLYFLCCSNDQNSERERLARLDRIQHLTNRLQELDAQRRTTQHSLEQFNGAVSYAKQQKERLLYVYAVIMKV